MITAKLILYVIAAVSMIVTFWVGITLINKAAINRINRLAKAGKYKEAVDRLYAMLWTGSRLDEKHAWFRVLEYCRKNKYPDEMCIEAFWRWALHVGRDSEISKTEVEA